MIRYVRSGYVCHGGVREDATKMAMRETSLFGDQQLTGWALYIPVESIGVYN